MMGIIHAQDAQELTSENVYKRNFILADKQRNRINKHIMRAIKRGDYSICVTNSLLEENIKLLSEIGYDVKVISKEAVEISWEIGVK